MVSCGSTDTNKCYSGHNQVQKILLPPLSGIETSMHDLSRIQQFTESQPYKQQIMPSFQNQTVFYTNHYRFNQIPKYRKRRFSSQSDIGPMTDKLRNSMGYQSQPKFVKRKKTIRRSASPVKMNFSDQCASANHKVNKNNCNQNLSYINSPNDTDDTMNDFQNQPSPLTEIVDPPSDRSLTPTVLIESQLSKSKKATTVEGSSLSCSTSVFTKSQLNRPQTPKPKERSIEQNFTDIFEKFSQKNSEIRKQISRQTENFWKNIQSFDPRKDDVNMLQFTIDDNLFKLRENIRSTENFSIHDIQELNSYMFQLISEYSQRKNPDELLHIQSAISSTKDIIFENLIKWIKNTTQVDNQIQNMHSVLLEISPITKNYNIDNLITRPHLIGISREILGFKEEVTDVLSSLFCELDTWSRNLKQSENNDNDLTRENQILKKSQSLFQKQSDDLIKQLKNLQENSDKLKRKLQRTKEQAEQINAEKNFLKKENEILRKECKISHQQLDNLLSNLEYLKKSQKKLEQLKPILQKAERIFQENTLLKTTNKNLSKEKNTLKKRSNDLTNKLNGLKKLQGEHAKLQNEMQITKETLKKIHKKKKMLELENQSLKSKTKALQQQLSDLPKTLESIISKNKSDLQTQEEEASKSPVTNRVRDNNLFEYCFQINSNCSNNSKISIRNIIN